MTASYAGTALPVHDLDAAIAALRASGLRVSAARRLVLEALFKADGPVTAEEIAHGLGGRVPVSDLGSTYRNLETLEDIGIVRHVHLGHGPGRYAPAAREYLVCDGCGTVITVVPSALDAVRDVVRHTFGFTAAFSHFPIVGRCSACV